MSPDISVVIPTYRRPALLKKCLDSMLRQTFDHSRVEVIVVSDGPDPETERIVTPLSNDSDLKFRFLSLVKKAGPAAARNFGWKSAKGSLIVFTDDDCIADSAWLAELWNHFSRERRPVAFRGRIVVPVDTRPTDYERNIQRLEAAEFVTANCACSREVLEQTGGFDENFSMAWREDSDLHFKLIERRIPIRCLSRAVIVHPVRQAPWGISIHEQKKSMFNALLYKKYPGLYREKIQRRPPWHYYAIVFTAAIFLITLFMGPSIIMKASLALWIIFSLAFAVKRLYRTRKTPDHIAEMVITSFVIPFLSVYWRCYGSLKFKTLFI